MFVTPPAGVTHFLLLSATERSRYLRIAKAPRGPTLTFRIDSYAHMARAQAAPPARHCHPVVTPPPSFFASPATRLRSRARSLSLPPSPHCDRRQADVAAAQRRPRCPETAFVAPPLVVLNNFGTEQHMKACPGGRVVRPRADSRSSAAQRAGGGGARLP